MRSSFLKTSACFALISAAMLSPGAAAGKPDPRLDRMIGQMIMVGFVGASAKDKGVTVVLDLLRQGKIGGVILMGRNIKSPRQLRRLTAALSEAARVGKHPEALIAVDQEGGRVQRLRKKNGHESFPYSARTIAERCEPGEVRRVYEKLACQLRNAGVNVNFGPVVDLDITGRKNPIIGKLRRSFSSDADKVSLYSRWFISTHEAFGVLTAAKHFPGHGSSLTDSHKEFTNISKTWSPRELSPYRSLLKSGHLPMVMTGHLYHPRFSDGKAPASLSKKAIRGELRGKIGFDGVVITDDLQMKAVLGTYPLRMRIAMAVNAGNDIVLLSNTVKPYPTLGRVVHKIIRENVREKCPDESAQYCIARDTVTAAYGRVLQMKKALKDWANKPAICAESRSVKQLVKQLCTKARAASQGTDTH